MEAATYRSLAVLVALAIVFLVGLEAQALEPAFCAEDMSCWDWKTMGNQMAGYPTHGLPPWAGIIRHFGEGFYLAG